MFKIILCKLLCLGLFAAAYDLDMEWIVIKGISDFAGGRTLNEDAWRMFASVMAASLTFHILSDGMVFREWPHYRGKSYHQLL